MGLEAACSDSNGDADMAQMCQEGSTCNAQGALLRESCDADASFPSDDGEATSVREILASLDMMCGECFQTMSAWSQECSEEAGRATEFCYPDTACNATFWEMQVACRHDGMNMEACMDDEESCECKSSFNVTFCSSPQGMRECGALCASFTHPACQDESSCDCRMARNDKFCESCDTPEGCHGCDSPCTEKTMADMMILAMLSCMGLDMNAGPGSSCVKKDPTHPVWQNEDLWRRYKPRTCSSA